MQSDEPAIVVSGSPGAFTVCPVEVPELVGRSETCSTHREAMATARIWAAEMRRLYDWPVPVVDKSGGD